MEEEGRSGKGDGWLGAGMGVKQAVDLEWRSRGDMG